MHIPIYQCTAGFLGTATLQSSRGIAEHPHEGNNLQFSFLQSLTNDGLKSLYPVITDISLKLFEPNSLLEPASHQQMQALHNLRGAFDPDGPSWEISAYWTQPGPGVVFSILLLVGGDVVSRTLAQLAGSGLTPVALSFGMMPYCDTICMCACSVQEAAWPNSYADDE